MKKVDDGGPEAFNKAMDSILRADPRKIKAAMEADKRERAEKREEREKEK
jgi:hypothetical protein